ncbi:hypothetical protein [Aeromicrobium sp. CTD01-1L150]|uniref:hypothetical protein n=1 Tax=Aeromicrobium sp. CTD01-1L150 TaxID=3341830 RepID=UPI0035BF0B59
MLQRILIVLALLASSAFVASPAAAGEVPTDPPETAEAAAPAVEAPPPPPKQTAPLPQAAAPAADPQGPPENVPTPQDTGPAPHDQQASPERVAQEVAAAAANIDVTICHATDDGYNQITVSSNAILNGGHGNHGGDIIPPFEVDAQSYPGLNWDAAGQAIYNAGCVEAAADPDDPDDPNEIRKVTICHDNNGVKDYSLITISVNAIIKGAGHDGHAGDIIPPFEYDGGSYPGKNLAGGGQAILDAGCLDVVVVDPDDPNEIRKVTICHDNNGVKDYSLITISVNAIIKGAGHDGHAGDIIPPFEYDGGSYPGKNWTEGQGPLTSLADCVIGGVISGDPEVEAAYLMFGTCPADGPVILAEPLLSIVVQAVEGVIATFTVGDGLSGPWTVTFTAAQGYDLIGVTELTGNAGVPGDCGGVIGGDPDSDPDLAAGPTPVDFTMPGASKPAVVSTGALPAAGGLSLWLLMLGGALMLAGFVALRTPRSEMAAVPRVPDVQSVWSVPSAVPVVTGPVDTRRRRPLWLLLVSGLCAVLGIALLRSE